MNKSDKTHLKSFIFYLEEQVKKTQELIKILEILSDDSNLDKKGEL